MDNFYVYKPTPGLLQAHVVDFQFRKPIPISATMVKEQPLDFRRHMRLDYQTEEDILDTIRKVEKLQVIESIKRGSITADKFIDGMDGVGGKFEYSYTLKQRQRPRVFEHIEPSRIDMSK